MQVRYKPVIQDRQSAKCPYCKQPLINRSAGMMIKWECLKCGRRWPDNAYHFC